MNNTYMRFPDFKLKAVTLSYDDGVRQDKRLLSIMKKHGLKGTFNINSGLYSTSYNGEEKGRMTKAESLALYNDENVEVAVHGYKHLSLGSIDTALAVNDVITDRKELERDFHRVIKGMAYANGSYNDVAVDILRQCGIWYARTTVSTRNFNLPENWLKLHPTCHHNDPNLMELAKQFVERESAPYYWSNRPQMFYLWGHSYEFDNNDNWQVIEEFASYMGGRKDIWYATNGEIYEYVQACDRLEFSADATYVYNPSCLDVYIDYLGKKVVIPAGKTVQL